MSSLSKWQFCSEGTEVGSIARFPSAGHPTRPDLKFRFRENDRRFSSDDFQMQRGWTIHTFWALLSSCMTAPVIMCIAKLDFHYLCSKREPNLKFRKGIVRTYLPLYNSSLRWVFALPIIRQETL